MSLIQKGAQSIIRASSAFGEPCASKSSTSVRYLLPVDVAMPLTQGRLCLQDYILSFGRFEQDQAIRLGEWDDPR
jgi:hypothetical protein